MNQSSVILQLKYKDTSSFTAYGLMGLYQLFNPFAIMNTRREYIGILKVI